MGTSSIPGLEKLIGTLRDGSLLRYSLGLEYAKLNQWGKAIEHFRNSLAADPGYSAAWRALGRALEAEGRSGEALEAYRSGIEAAEKKGDKQALKEMTVFARRIEKKLAG
jgi:tetratricopeptide (TPR) repeat protein